MKLRTRLLVGYGYLVTLLVVTAVLAALGLQRLGGDVRRALDENVISMRAAATMLDALERQDRATIDLLLGKEDARGSLVVAEHDGLRALDLVASRAFAPGEPELIAALREDEKVLRAARARLLETKEAGLLRAYEREVAAPYTKVRDGAQRLLDLNQESIATSAAAARGEARAGSVGLGALVAVAVLSFGFLSRGLQRGVLARLAELQDVCLASAQGDLRRRLRVRKEDELGVVARALNAAFDRQAALQGQMEGRLNQQAQLLIGLIAREPRPVAVLALDGEALATTLDAPDQARLGKLAAAVRALDHPVDPSGARTERAVKDAEVQYDLELIIAAGRRPVGWVALPRPAVGAAPVGAAVPALTRASPPPPPPPRAKADGSLEGD